MAGMKKMTDGLVEHSKRQATKSGEGKIKRHQRPGGQKTLNPARRQSPIGNSKSRRTEKHENRQNRHPIRHVPDPSLLHRAQDLHQNKTSRHRSSHVKQYPPRDSVPHILRQFLVLVLALLVAVGLPLAFRGWGPAEALCSFCL
nr:hypothetical protein Iba_chr11dCG5040 [Ipomoea batatas]